MSQPVPYGKARRSLLASHAVETMGGYWDQFIYPNNHRHDRCRRCAHAAALNPTLARIIDRGAAALAPWRRWDRQEGAI